VNRLLPHTNAASYPPLAWRLHFALSNDSAACHLWLKPNSPGKLHGFARGAKPVRFADRIRTYHPIVVQATKDLVVERDRMGTTARAYLYRSHDSWAGATGHVLAMLICLVGSSSARSAKGAGAILKDERRVSHPSRRSFPLICSSKNPIVPW
jgi:hypothetical protein